MKLIKKDIAKKNGEGFITIVTEEEEDFYHAFNMIDNGDMITAETVRNVVKESNTGTTSKTRLKLRLKISVERVEFDSEQCSLRVNGKNVLENEHVKMGQYHTIDLELGKSFSIEKPCWDSIFLDRLKEACDPGQKAELAVVVMQEGLANVCLVTTSMTLVRAKIEKKIPRKNQLNQAHDKARSRFYDEVYEAVKRHVDFTVVKVVIVGSPGFMQDEFMKHLTETATRQGDSALLKQRSKFLKAHTSSGHKKAIDELLSNPDFKGQLAEVRAADEVRALQTFYDTLSQDPDRACYSFAHVELADEQLGVEALLVTDKLFKAADYGLRAKYVALVESVKDHGGKVFIFSSMHVTGEQLDLYTGVAATLRFPMPDLDLQIETVAKQKRGLKLPAGSLGNAGGGGGGGGGGASSGRAGGVMEQIDDDDSDFSATTVDGGDEDEDENDDDGLPEIAEEDDYLIVDDVDLRKDMGL